MYHYTIHPTPPLRRNRCGTYLGRSQDQANGRPRAGPRFPDVTPENLVGTQDTILSVQLLARVLLGTVLFAATDYIRVGGGRSGS
eukprot:8326293-Heterocapsa_arctica.AAC.1